ncbi:TPA: hypothetical protein N0F65_004553 [Lagenidium giganteum]|uniref:UDENN domain-containing protein n=1 Tax=Lagenidium giganteum TaxID=4803 RepID=A0AAV2ZAB0_9STRA|nr:TPA: hypothetical protein N0F65_004553 [Lagenidium giganteum]
MAEVVLYAEFDIDKGSTLRESYPTAIAHYSPEFFADVMLPEGVHNREEDFTVFFLNRQQALKKPSADDAAADAANVSANEHATVVVDPLKNFMYCLSVVRTTYDNTVRRGARVNAVALCSQHKHCFAFKDVLDMAVRQISMVKDDSDTKRVLKELFDVINAVDMGGARTLSDMERRLLKRTVCDGNSVSSTDVKQTEDSLFYHTKAEWMDMKIPLQFKLCSTEDQHDDGLLIKLVAKFAEQVMILYNAVLTGQRVIVLGYNRPAGEVCNYVLATSALVCPPLFGLIHRQFPYANLTDLGFLSTPGFIAGVTNPMFKTKKDWWDVLCDISTGEVLVSTPVEKEEFDGVDRTFIMEVIDGVIAGYNEEWVRCQFEEYTRQNIVDIATGEANYMDVEAQVKRTAMNNKRITKWARTDNYKLFQDSRSRNSYRTPAFNISSSRLCKTGVDLKRHIRSLQGESIMHDDAHVERIYADFISLLHTEEELQEFLSFLPLLRGGLQTVAQGIFHPSISVKYNTVILLKRLEGFASTVSSLRLLNPFIMMSYQRIHSLVQPETRG